jgi:hypothetical protein
MYSFAIHRTLATDASLHPRIHPPRTNHESSAAAGVPTSVRPHISHTHEKKNPNPPSFQSRRLLFRFEPTGPSWDVIDGSRTANHKGTRPLSFLSKKRTRRERRERQKKRDRYREVRFSRFVNGQKTHAPLLHPRHATRPPSVAPVVALSRVVRWMTPHRDLGWTTSV